MDFLKMFNTFRPIIQQVLPKAVKQFEATEARLAREVLVGEAGAGLVKATASGAGKLIALDISDSLMKEPKSVVEDLTLSAVNEALDAVDTMREKEGMAMAEELMRTMGGFGGMGFPGLPKNN